MDNKAADALSRKLEGVELVYLVVPTLLDITAFSAEVYEDTKLREIIEKLKVDEDSVPNFPVQQGVLKFRGRLVISKTSSLLPAILHTYHDSVFRGHLDFLHTYKRLLNEFYWKGMKKDVQMSKSGVLEK